jgi:hypothetical protein
MNVSFFWPLAMGGFLVVGCSDPKGVNKTNFQRVINEKLKTEKLCVDPLRRVMPAGNVENGFPVAVTSGVPDLELFAHAGLLATAPSTAVPMISYDKKPVPATTYSLTEKGQQSYSGAPKYNFCYGTPEATSVTEYTEPADMFGTHITQVTFVLGIPAYADWASDPAIQKRFGTAKPGAKGTATLQLTSEGWRVADRGISYK